MFFGPEILAAHAALVMAATPVQCRLKQAPAITMRVITDNIDYDYSRSAETLTRMKSDTVNPYPKGSDTVTSGLREDHPEIKSEMQWDVEYDSTGTACMFFRTVSVTIHLRPKIYLAREYNVGQCREAVLGHERKHIQVDREVMNKYASLVGAGLQNTLNRVGALGPFNIKNQEAVKKQASGYIRQTLDVYEKQLSAELRTRQQGVDTLAEYERVGSFCRGVRP